MLEDEEDKGITEHGKGTHLARYHSPRLALGRVTRLADLVLEAAGAPGPGHGAQDHLLLRVEVEADPEAGHVLREADIVRGRAPPSL